MSNYEVLVFVHVLAVAVWVGGAVVMQALGLRALRSDDPAAVARRAGDVEWVGTRIFAPANVILLAAGIWAVEEGGWDYGDGWILFGLAVWVLSFVVGMGFIGPESGRVKRLVADLGPEAPEVTARVVRIEWIARIELLLLIAVIAVMVAKPGL